MARTIWVKGPKLGSGSYGTVFKGITNHPNYPSIAVKSATYPRSIWLAKEELILRDLQGSDNVVRCLGNDLSIDEDNNNEVCCNMFLEYAPGGTLEDLIKGSKLEERDVAKYTRMILQGLRHVHGRGYVHCDLKPSNILVFEGNHLKIADFGLSKKVGVYERRDGISFKGTPRYMSPESVRMGENEPPLDIWSLGCIVVEMVTGKPLWSCTDMKDLYYSISYSHQSLELPKEMSDMGRDFLNMCFVVNGYKRWTADMLFNHPFIAENLQPLSLPRWSLPPHLLCWIGKYCDNELVKASTEFDNQRYLEFEAQIIRDLEKLLLEP